MAYITREDGERFVIPSYRDVISAKKQSLLKKEVLLLSSNYGEYITLHRKNVEQYEVAFSPDTGYLLGETVWHYFKRPLDLIYCEAIPNTSEAILVIVKSGSVYLDGSFSVDSIADELVIFKTQHNNFDIYVYGDVPISNTPEADKFTFDSTSVRSFQFLDEPAFPKLPKVKNFQLQLVDTVLKSQGIGVFPVKNLLIIAAVLGILWLGWEWITTHKKAIPSELVNYYVNPYQVYLDSLTSPDPVDEIKNVADKVRALYSIPGWTPDSIEYSKNKYHISVKSSGEKTTLLFDWAKKNNATIQILTDGFYVNWTTLFAVRPAPKTIANIDNVIASIVDNIAEVMPGNHIQIGAKIDRKSYVETILTISFTNITPDTLLLIGDQLKDLPLVLNKVSMTALNGNLTGTMIFQALGS